MDVSHDIYSHSVKVSYALVYYEETIFNSLQSGPIWDHSFMLVVEYQDVYRLVKMSRHAFVGSYTLHSLHFTLRLSALCDTSHLLEERQPVRFKAQGPLMHTALTRTHTDITHPECVTWVMTRQRAPQMPTDLKWGVHNSWNLHCYVCGCLVWGASQEKFKFLQIFKLLFVIFDFSGAIPQDSLS